RARRNDNLCRPTVRRSGRASIPDAIPVEGSALRIRYKAVRPSAGGINPKEVSGAMVTVRVQHNADRVVSLRVSTILVTLHCVDSDAAWIGVFADKGEINVIAGDDN